MLFAHPLRDHLPWLDQKLCPEWEAIASARETALAKRALKVISEEKQELEPLQHPAEQTRWSKENFEKIYLLIFVKIKVKGTSEGAVKKSRGFPAA